MDEQVTRLKNWVSHGTMRQFYTEMQAKLANTEYTVELSGDTVTFYRVRKEGGFLGLFARRVREKLLQVSRQDDQIVIAEGANPEFIQYVNSLLKQH
ncbi:MAG: hypothetical protein H5T70_01225 [Chloroflexi bacterium]|nr:hypothetical protein [Chloroflexota bacterium]